MSLSFETTRDEFDLIRKIVDRAEELGLVRRGDDRLSLHMDFAACHANGCPMDFARFLAADDFNFTHDFTGIIACMDRGTGLLTKHFLPRFHRTDALAA